MAATPPDVPSPILAVLAPGESVIAFAWGRVPRFGTPFVTFFPIGFAVELVDLIRNHRHLSKLRDRTRGGGFPLDRNMALAATSTRLLVWSASKHPRRIGAFLGDVPQSLIRGAKAPFTGQGPWKTVGLWFTDGTFVRFQVDVVNVESLVSSLQKRPAP